MASSLPRHTIGLESWINLLVPLHHHNYIFYLKVVLVHLNYIYVITLISLKMFTTASAICPSYLGYPLRMNE